VIGEVRSVGEERGMTAKSVCLPLPHYLHVAYLMHAGSNSQQASNHCLVQNSAVSKQEYCLVIKNIRHCLK